MDSRRGTTFTGTDVLGESARVAPGPAQVPEDGTDDLGVEDDESIERASSSESSSRRTDSRSTAVRKASVRTSISWNPKCTNLPSTRKTPSGAPLMLALHGMGMTEDSFALLLQKLFVLPFRFLIPRGPLPVEVRRESRAGASWYVYDGDPDRFRLELDRTQGLLLDLLRRCVRRRRASRSSCARSTWATRSAASPWPASRRGSESASAEPPGEPNQTTPRSVLTGASSRLPHGSLPGAWTRVGAAAAWRASTPRIPCSARPAGECSASSGRGAQFRPGTEPCSRRGRRHPDIGGSSTIVVRAPRRAEREHGMGWIWGTIGVAGNSKAGRSAASLALAAAASAVGLVVAEAVLRVAGVSYPSFYTVDAHLGFAHRPGASGWFGGEGGAEVRINSDGLRDREHAVAKPPGTFRIAVLGDSYTQALQVPLEQTFCAVLEHELERKGALVGRDVEVLNFGVASYGTAQELLALRQRVWRYRPDLVLLAFLSLNDIQENSRALIGEDLRPYFVLHDDRFVLDTSFRESTAYVASRTWQWRAKHGALERSALLQLVCEAKRIAAQRRGRRAVDPGDVDAQLYRDPTDPAWREAWRVTECLLVAIRDECARHDAGFAVVILSNPVQVHPDSAVRGLLATRLGVGDLFYPERRIRSLGERAGFPVLELAPALQAYAEANGVCVHGFDNAVPCGGHWNAAGHRLAGSLMSEFVSGRFDAGATAPRRR